MTYEPGDALGTLANIWTYPVKSLKRVEHDAVDVERDGLAGDRRAALYVESAEHARTGKTYRGKEDERLHTIVEPELARRAAGERSVDIAVHAGAGRYFDARPVSLVFDRWLADVERMAGRDLDPLRWRPNFFIRDSAALDEDDLVDKRMVLGDVTLLVVATIKRCVTTTYDIETGASDPNVHRVVAQQRANVFGIYCEVERTGTVRVGDALKLGD